jgi:hypothetical protein
MKMTYLFSHNIVNNLKMIWGVILLANCPGAAQHQWRRILRGEPPVSPPSGKEIAQDRFAGNGPIQYLCPR